jgi:hypothetical protein
MTHLSRPDKKCQTASATPRMRMTTSSVDGAARPYQGLLVLCNRCVVLIVGCLCLNDEYLPDVLRAALNYCGVSWGHGYTLLVCGGLSVLCYSNSWLSADITLPLLVEISCSALESPF